jgi:hypothetical protein
MLKVNIKQTYVNFSFNHDEIALLFGQLPYLHVWSNNYLEVMDCISNCNRLSSTIMGIYSANTIENC